MQKSKPGRPRPKTLKIGNIKGVFANTGNVRGVTSGTEYNILNYDPQTDQTEMGDSQNSDIEDEIETLIDNSENNPFGDV